MAGARRRPAVLALSLVAAAGLAVDAAVHLHLAGSYSMVGTGITSEAALFRVEGGMAALCGLAVVALPNRATALLALLASVAGVAAVLLYTYVDLGPIGPFPDMYEPVWYPEKTFSYLAEAAAALVAAALVLLTWRARRLPTR